MSIWTVGLTVLRDSAATLIAWATAVLVFGQLLGRPRRRRTMHTPPTKKRPLSRADFTLAA